MIESKPQDIERLLSKLVAHRITRVQNNIVPRHMPAMIHGSPGIGKSAITRSMCKKMMEQFSLSAFGFVDIRLAQFEPADVGGIPYVSRAGWEQIMVKVMSRRDNGLIEELDGELLLNGEEEMRFSIPSWFPTEDRVNRGLFPKFGILFCDELTNAPTGTQHAAYRLILDREAQHGIKLAEGWEIIAAGNRKSDKTGAQELKPALANRFGMHLYMVADVDQFIQYIYESSMDFRIAGFLRNNPQYAYQFDPAKSGEAFPSPRSWEAASNIMNIGYEIEDEMIALDGCVGAAATSFYSFLKYYDHLPDMDAIADGKETFTVPTDNIGVVCALTSSLIAKIISLSDKPEKMKNLNDRLLNQIPDDFCVMVFSSIRRACPDMTKQAKILQSTKSNFERVRPYIKTT